MPGEVSLSGDCISFFPDGKKKSITYYSDGKKEGNEYLFYPTGTIYCLRKYLMISHLGWTATI